MAAPVIAIPEKDAAVLSPMHAPHTDTGCVPRPGMCSPPS
jgi:hypothetical protein